MSKDILYPLRVLHGKLHYFRTIALPYVLQRLRNPKAAYFVMTPTHGNLGDHAIASATVRLLKENNIPYIELTDRDIRNLYCHNCLGVMNGRKIYIIGGGNMGTLWFEVEKQMRSIIKSNPRSSIYILPNTIYYEKSPEGNKEKENSVAIYGKHSHLSIYAREKISYNTMTELYKNVKLIPDMVLSMNECIESAQKRKGCLLCLRSDLERTRSEQEETEIFSQVTVLFNNNIEYADMVVDHMIELTDRENELKMQFDRFRHAELVITDRLHGMIFAAITGTPCIVIDSKSPKVRGCYEWIKHLDYIKFADDVEDISRLYKEIPPGSHKYDNVDLLPYFQKLAQDIQNYRR